jgi:hypothetical protein
VGLSAKGRAKVVARRLVDGAGAMVGHAQLRWSIRGARDRTITVLDIDNTLADTWPSYLEDWPDHRLRLRALAELSGMRAAVYEPAVRRGDVVVFLSHRNWWEWGLTRKWLLDHGYAVPTASLVLVPSAAAKVAHLSRLTRAGTVVYWDDLSHGQESGTPQRYDEVVTAVQALRLEYHGVDEIEAIVAAAGGR